MTIRVSHLISCLLVIAVSAVIGFGCSFPPLNSSPYDYFMSWKPGPNVAYVSIDADFNSTQREQLAHGVLNWNLWGLLDCSLMEFAGGESRQFEPQVITKATPLQLGTFTLFVNTVISASLEAVNCKRTIKVGLSLSR